MVRQFEETRRSQLTIVHHTDQSAYSSDDEFELAVSVTASIAVQVILDGTQISVVSENLPLRTRSVTSLLDDSCRLEPTKRVYASAREFVRRTTQRLPSPSVAILVAGSGMPLAEFRTEATLFPADARILVARVIEGAAPALANVGGMTVATIGQLSSLPAMMSRAVTA
jgi:hypothetical protein